MLNISCRLDQRIFLKFYWHVEQSFLRNVWRDFKLPMSAIVTVTGKSFTANILQTLIIRSFICVAIAYADIESH